jgi:integrase
MKFDPKKYQGKERVYPEAVGAPGIRRVWVWDSSRNEYVLPTRGKCFLARRYETTEGKRVRVSRYFDSLSEARGWQSFVQKVEALPVNEPATQAGPTFGEIVLEWQRRKYNAISEGTKLQYERMLRKHFQCLLAAPIHEITPKRIDSWIDDMRALSANGKSGRKAFDHELTLLGVILRYYAEYHDGTGFVFPVKRRHRKAVEGLTSNAPKQKDLSEEEFLRFRDELKKGYLGPMMAALAAVQYYQALRVSEVAALHWGDLVLDRAEPSKSRLSVVRSVFWPRRKGMESYVKAGFKNAKANNGIKEQPVLPESFKALASLEQSGGLVFQVDGKHLEYRTIQNVYDRAFKRAGLAYSGTHIMRHGGCRRLFNQNGDLAVAQQLLGNADMKSALVYAQRHKGALTAVVLKEWENMEVRSTGRNGSQIHGT